MGRLRKVLVSAALVAGLAAAGPVRADEVNEELPWWAQPDYDVHALDLAAAPDPHAELPEPVETAVDPSWWAGGADAVLVLSAGDPPSEVTDDASHATGSAEADEVDDGGRNPLFNRAEGHRAGEDPAGTSGGGDPETLLEEERDDRGTNECRRLPNQLARYEAQLEAGGMNERATAALEAHIARLEARRERRCPEPKGPDPLLVTLKVLMKAAKIAARVARYMYGSPI